MATGTLEKMKPSDSFLTVTEMPGSGGTPEHLSMLYTRYKISADLAAGKDVLELACGPGIGLGYLAKRARRVVGGDYEQENVEIGRRYYGARMDGEKLDLRQMDAQALPYPEGSFDVVLLLEALYFLPDAEAFVAEARRVLRPGGALFVCCANPERPDFNAAPLSHRYYSVRELGELFRRHGFTTELFTGFPLEKRGLKGQLFDVLRRVAVKLHLIPKTMDGKEALKRLLYGKLKPLPQELSDDTGELHTLTPYTGTAPAPDWKVVYAIGRLAAE